MTAKLALGALLGLLTFPAAASSLIDFTHNPYDPTPRLEIGAAVFENRCTLCHGVKGMGEGTLSLALNSYPSTNLLEPKFGSSRDALYKAIFWGGSKGEMHNAMPPWGDELTATELESVVLFVSHLREQPKQAAAMVEKLLAKGTDKGSMKLGRTVFKSRCALCHGAEGEGNGKMAKIIKNPPPFNLTQSGVPYAYVKEIVAKGGEAMGRSGQMPPWADELTPAELESVLIYIMSLRAFK